MSITLFAIVDFFLFVCCVHYRTIQNYIERFNLLIENMALFKKFLNRPARFIKTVQPCN